MPDINAHERRAFSQNGEDGIIALLAAAIRSPSRRFVEIGTSDGAQNNSFNLLRGGWRGLGVDADEGAIRRYAARVRGTPLEPRLSLAACRVDWHNCLPLVEEHGDMEPDFFSLDIDGIDYYVASRLLGGGFRPKVACCEFNSFLGERPLTVAYDEAFARYRYDPQRGLYFGASVAAWRHLFEGFGYRFCGVESAGVNAFFCRTDAFDAAFIGEVTGLAHAYTAVFVRKYGLSGPELSRELLARPGLRFVDVAQEDVALEPLRAR